MKKTVFVNLILFTLLSCNQYDKRIDECLVNSTQIIERDNIRMIKSMDRYLAETKNNDTSAFRIIKQANILYKHYENFKRHIDSLNSVKLMNDEMKKFYSFPIEIEESDKDKIANLSYDFNDKVIILNTAATIINKLLVRINQRLIYESICTIYSYDYVTENDTIKYNNNYMAFLNIRAGREINYEDYHVKWIKRNGLKVNDVHFNIKYNGLLNFTKPSVGHYEVLTSVKDRIPTYGEERELSIKLVFDVIK